MRRKGSHPTIDFMLEIDFMLGIVKSGRLRSQVPKVTRKCGFFFSQSWRFAAPGRELFLAQSHRRGRANIPATPV
jgi:hypothetical protein